MDYYFLVQYEHSKPWNVAASETSLLFPATMTLLIFLSSCSLKLGKNFLGGVTGKRTEATGGGGGGGSLGRWTPLTPHPLFPDLGVGSSLLNPFMAEREVLLLRLLRRMVSLNMAEPSTASKILFGSSDVANSLTWYFRVKSEIRKQY